MVSESGQVKGDIFASKVVINGIFEGTCHADKIEVLAKGRVSGTIYTDDLSIEQGGKFNGVTHPAKPKEQQIEQHVVEIKSTTSSAASTASAPSSTPSSVSSTATTAKDAIKPAAGAKVAPTEVKKQAVKG